MLQAEQDAKDVGIKRGSIGLRRLFSNRAWRAFGLGVVDGNIEPSKPRHIFLHVPGLWTFCYPQPDSEKLLNESKYRHQTRFSARDDALSPGPFERGSRRIITGVLSSSLVRTKAHCSYSRQELMRRRPLRHFHWLLHNDIEGDHEAENNRKEVDRQCSDVDCCAVLEAY
jgi:hypothetical protein